MFSSLLRTPLAALVTYVVVLSTASAVSAAPSLTVRTSASDADLKVIATIVNSGDETLKLLNDPRGVMSSFPEDSFIITDSSGSRPLFHGAKVSYSPTHAAGLGGPNVFTVLAPGDSISVTHDLSDAYSFTKSGAGEYSIKPLNLFTYIGADGTPKDLHATVEGVAKVKIPGDLAVSKRHHDKRITPKGGCTSRVLELIPTAASAAQSAVSESLKYLEGMKDSTTRYKTWFGNDNATRKKTVLGVFQKISQKTKFSTLTYDCSCKLPHALSYVVPGNPKVIFICPLFEKSTPDHQTMALIQSASNFKDNGGALNHKHGAGESKKLAIADPAKAVHNGDSYAFFAVNKPHLG